MVNLSFWKDIIREIINTKGRFISILIITLLGAAMVTGIQATSINMRYAAHVQYRAANLYDLQVRFPTAVFVRQVTDADTDGVDFSQTVPEVFQQMEAVYRAVGANVLDVYTYVQGTRRVIRTYTLTEGVNEVTLVEGRLPAAYNEIAVEGRHIREGRLALGDVLSLARPDIYEHLITSEFTVVGVVASPMYQLLSHERGNTTLGAGVVQFFAYLHPSAYHGFTNPLFPMTYTDLFLIMAASRDMHQVSHAYNEAALVWRQEAENVLADMGIPAFVLTRQNGIGFESYFQDSLRLEQVGYVFPLLFFFVAVLVALTTISRMVEAQRGQIGIYKALGYSPFAIIVKYTVYAFVSGFLGGVAGVVLGSQIISRVIFAAYAHMYTMPHSNHPIPWGIAAIAVLAAAGSILVTALLTCMSALKGEAAALMRPKAPKIGKRVLLERIPFIWRHLGFIGKVTARNIFRYKRRLFMTLAGVAGCTALVLVAFGLRDSIGSVSRLQFEEINVFDYQLHLRDVDITQKAELSAYVQGDVLFIRTITADAHTDYGGFSAAIVVPRDFGALSRFVRMLAPQQGFLSGINPSRRYVQPHGEGVLVTEKLAREMNIQAGDYFSILVGMHLYRIRAAGVVENFVQHFIYMPREYYTGIFGREWVANGAYVLGEVYREGIMNHSASLAVTGAVSMRNSLSGQTDALGVVTIVILVMACILAFVVMFNLTEINIIERKRELATIRVLGFFDRETAMYLYRENLVVTAIGIFLGLFGGIFLNQFVLSTAEIDVLKFPHVIFPLSFVWAAVLSLVFTLVVNVATYRRITSIDMVSALKSVE